MQTTFNQLRTCFQVFLFQESLPRFEIQINLGHRIKMLLAPDRIQQFQECAA